MTERHIQVPLTKEIFIKLKKLKKKYHKCIQTYIGSPKELGNTDVSGFIERIPKEFLNTTSSSTSLQGPGVN